MEACPSCPVVRCFATAESAVEEITDENGCIWSLRAFPVMSASVEGGVRQVVLMAEEVTDKRINEQRQMRANQLAALGELAAGVAHEINNPISGVINYAQLVVNYTRITSYNVCYTKLLRFKHTTGFIHLPSGRGKQSGEYAQ